MKSLLSHWRAWVNGVALAIQDQIGDLRVDVQAGAAGRLSATLTLWEKGAERNSASPVGNLLLVSGPNHVAATGTVLEGPHGSYGPMSARTPTSIGTMLYNSDESPTGLIRVIQSARGRKSDHASGSHRAAGKRWSYFVEDQTTGQRQAVASKTVGRSVAKAKSLATGHAIAIVAVDAHDNGHEIAQGAYYGRTWRHGMYTRTWKTGR